MSKVLALYVLHNTTLNREKCSWRREHFKLTLAGKLTSVSETEDKVLTFNRYPKLWLPAGCVLSTRAEYTAALLRYRKAEALRQQQLAQEKAQRKASDKKLAGIRGLGATSAPEPAPMRVAATPEVVAGAGLFDDFTIVDTEYQGEHLLEVAAIRYKNWQPVAQLVSYVRFREWVTPRTTELTGITAEVLHNAPQEKAVLQAFVQLAEGSLLIAHNIGADRSQLERARHRQGAEGELPNRWFCTMRLARARLPKSTPCGLGELCQRFGFSRHGAHQALRDVEMCFQVLRHFYQEDPILSLDPKARKAAPTLFAA
jgi:DNA polymerase-3 subunit epsilon